MDPVPAIDVGVQLAVINDLKDNETNNVRLGNMMRNARI